MKVLLKDYRKKETLLKSRVSIDKNAKGWFVSGVPCSIPILESFRHQIKSYGWSNSSGFLTGVVIKIFKDIAILRVGKSQKLIGIELKYIKKLQGE